VTRHIRSVNAEYQVLQALRVNRQTRNRENAFIVAGVRNINAAIEHGWIVRSALVPAASNRSKWAASVCERVDDVAEMASDLFEALTDRDEAGELLVVCEKRAVAVADIALTDDFVAVVLDRPSNPGNVGTIIRSTDALGGRAVVLIGHGVDPYEPRVVRASTGSFFALPVVEAGRIDELLSWGARLVATDEVGDDISGADLTPPLALLFGNETRGLARALRAAADVTVAIPMRGTASSLNVAAAHAIVMYDVYRRHHDPDR
jgi:TrmH family RNA methyltransferase